MVTLGPRVLKTGLAVTFALYMAAWLGLEPPLFAGIAATFTIQPSIYRSWKQVLEQVQANILAAAIALASIYLFGNSPVVIGLVMIIVILVCLRLNMSGAIPLTLVTVLVMMSQQQYDGLAAAANKFIIVLVGMGSAFVVNLLVSPPNYKKNYLEAERLALDKLSLLLRTAVSDELTEKSNKQQWKKARGELKKMEELYKLLDEEREHIAKVRQLDVREIVVLKQKLKCLWRGERLLDMIDEHFFQSEADDDWRSRFDADIEGLVSFHEMAVLRFEGKIKEAVSSSSRVESTRQLLDDLSNAEMEEEQKFRLLLVATSAAEYAYQLERLHELTVYYLKKKELGGGEKKTLFNRLKNLFT